ncbi:MAG: DUF4870 domain-containing protein [Spirulina sp.]
MMILAHVLGLLTGFIGPLIIYLVTEDPEVKRHARIALNWQISLLIYLFVSVILMFVVIGFFLFFIALLLDLVFCIMAALKANDGIAWKYPLTIPLIKE